MDYLSYLLSVKQFLKLLKTLFTLQVDDVKKLCKACGVDPCGSKTDLILRLHNEIRSRSTYDKLFEKVWGASGMEPYYDFVNQ